MKKLQEDILRVNQLSISSFHITLRLLPLLPLITLPVDPVTLVTKNMMWWPKNPIHNWVVLIRKNSIKEVLAIAASVRRLLVLDYVLL